MNKRTETITATAPAGASTSAVTSGTGIISGLSDFDTLSFFATITGGTGGTLDVIVEDSDDGTDWYEYCHFAQVAAATASTQRYSPALNDTVVAVGKNLTTTMTLASGAGAGGKWQDRMRLRFVTGSGNSAGVSQTVRIVATNRQTR